MTKLVQPNPTRLRVAIELESVTKDFGFSWSLGKLDPTSLYRLLALVWGSPLFHFGRKKVFSTEKSHSHFLRNLTLSISPGDITGFAGPSGSGKTVLLKIMAGIMPISAGSIEIHGTVVSLLSLGDNLERTQTIRENVASQARMLGFDEQAASNFYNAVVGFAELQEFEDVPIRYFSTGMQMRVSIAMALSANADIILLDDVLEVGDTAFQEKCIERLRALRTEGRTIVVVMQNEHRLATLANRIVHLNNGTIVSDKRPTESREEAFLPADSCRFQWHLSPTAAENAFVSLRSVTPQLKEQDGRSVLNVNFNCLVKRPQRFRPLVDVRFGRLLVFRTLYDESIHVEGPLSRPLQFSLDLPIWLFVAGTFFIDLGFLSIDGEENHSLKTRGLITLKIRSTSAADVSLPVGIIEPHLVWTLTSLATTEHE